MPLNLFSGHWWAMNWCFHSSLLILSSCFKGVVVKTTGSVCKVVGFPYGDALPTLYPLCLFITLLFSILAALCGQSLSLIIWLMYASQKSLSLHDNVFFLDHFCIWWVGHIPVQIPKGLFWVTPFYYETPFSPSFLPFTWSFEDHYAMAGYFLKESWLNILLNSFVFLDEEDLRFP